MDGEDSLRALSEYKSVCIHLSHKIHLSDFCVLILTSPNADSRQQKKSSRKTIMQPQRSRRRAVHLENLQKNKRNHPGNSCWHKEKEEPGVTSCQLTQSCCSEESTVKQETAPSLGRMQCRLLENRNLHCLLSFKPQSLILVASPRNQSNCTACLLSQQPF